MYFVFKRIVDILTAIIALILLSPLILIICIAIKLESKGSVLFRQTRVGIRKSLLHGDKYYTGYYRAKTAKLGCYKAYPAY